MAGVNANGLRTVTLTPTAVALSVASGLALAANTSRSYARFINDSAIVVYLMVGAAAVANTGIRLEANGGTYTMSVQEGNLDTRVVNAIAASATPNLLVIEGT